MHYRPSTVQVSTQRVVFLPVVQSKMNFAKQCSHEINFCCSAWGIWCQKSNIRQRPSIMLGFARSIAVPFTGTRDASAVSKNGVSLISWTSCLQNVLGLGKYPMSPSEAWRKSAHAAIIGFHRKSIRKIISASSTPIQAKEPVAISKWEKLSLVRILLHLYSCM